MPPAGSEMQASRELSPVGAPKSTSEGPSEARQALETFILDNADLETLEGMLEQFNIFEALGVVRREVRHSDFLAFLLDPPRTIASVMPLLDGSCKCSSFGPGGVAPVISPILLGTWDLSHLTVRRE
jgi:hypothetical protein